MQVGAGGNRPSSRRSEPGCGGPNSVVDLSVGALGRPGSAPRADARNPRHSPAGTIPKAPGSSSISARAVPCDRAPTISLRLEIVKRSDDTKGFVVLPRRWVVERTFS